MNADGLNRTTNGHTAASSGGTNPGLETNNHSFAQQSAAMYRALCSVVREKDVAAMARKVMEKALAGDLPAIKLLLAYVLGPRSLTKPPHSR